MQRRSLAVISKVVPHDAPHHHEQHTQHGLLSRLARKRSPAGSTSGRRKVDLNAAVWHIYTVWGFASSMKPSLPFPAYVVRYNKDAPSATILPSGKLAANLYSANVDGIDWKRIDFELLAMVDVVESLAQCDMRRQMTKTGVFKPIESY